ncbi:unnamed protein product [Gordionus sp. m RMFG-2023]|uniref:DGAT1/2-independent enzyme synthesizing storage lipids-like n=1 Tax=Gordionus sp. m RMFG-2023 TaxID=3053472 RepID=UPI0030E021BD
MYTALAFIPLTCLFFSFVLFFIPFGVFLFLYLQAISLHIYRRKLKLNEPFSKKIWNAARKIIANLWLLHASIWHGYEICGLENIPKNKPAILILYHGTVPVDFYYFVTLMSVDPDRRISVIGDKFLFKIPGLAILMRLFYVHPGTFESCCQDLSDNKLLIISPGGAREAVFSDDYYSLVWNHRSGFAKIALKQNVPIIPAFTQNIREGYRVATFGLSIFRKFYEKYRLPLIPIYGGFPVKMKTFIGEPLYPNQVFPSFADGNGDAIKTKFNDSDYIEKFVNASKTSLENLIKAHQTLPGNIWKGLAQRLTDKPFTLVTTDKVFDKSHLTKKIS